MDRDESMLTWKDVAKLIQVSVRTLERMVADREFPPPVKVRGSDRWTLGELRLWQARLRWAAEAGQIATIPGQIATNSDSQENGSSNRPKPR